MATDRDCSCGKYYSDHLRQVQFHSWCFVVAHWLGMHSEGESENHLAPVLEGGNQQVSSLLAIRTRHLSAQIRHVRGNVS